MFFVKNDVVSFATFTKMPPRLFYSGPQTTDVVLQSQLLVFLVVYPDLVTDKPSFKEVCDAVLASNGEGAPSPDGFNACFF